MSKGQETRRIRKIATPTVTVDTAVEEGPPGTDTEETVSLGAGPRRSQPDADTESTPAAVGRDTSLPRGSTVDRYVILSTLGMGGMGAVYAAYDPRLDRKVALKLVRSDRVSSPALAYRLQREAKAIARLSHPNIVTVHDVGQTESGVYVAMEFVPGQTLRQWQESKSSRLCVVTELLPVYCQAGLGLAAAHAAGLVHRDFKPDNVLIGNDGRVRVLDFGLVALTSETTTPKPDEPEDSLISGADELDIDHGLAYSSSLHERLTMTQAVVGTPAYMAPEQHVGRTTDVRADIFSFCVSLFEAIYRKRPFATEEKGRRGFDALGQKKLAGDIERHGRKDVPQWLHNAIMRGLRSDPNDRWQTMDELLAVLRRSYWQRYRKPIVALGIVTLLAMLGASSVFRPPSSAGTPQCTLPRDRLAGIWDEPRKDIVRQGLLATGVSFAESTATLLEKRVNAYTEGWMRMYQQACEATHVYKTQSQELLNARHRCLDHHLTELDMQLTLLAKADRDLVENALSGAAQLSPLSWCTDRRILLAQPDLPADPKIRGQLDALNIKFKEVKVLLNLGQLEQAAELAHDLLNASAAIDYLPFRAVALSASAIALAHQNRHKEAHDVLREAYWLSYANGLDRLAAIVARWLVWSKWSLKGNAEEVDEWIGQARATTARIGVKGFEEGELLATIGEIYAMQGKLPEAVLELERALAMLESTGEHPLTVVRLHTHLGNTHERLGDLDKAKAYYLRALAILEELQGSGHPGPALASSDVARIYLAQGKYEDALRYSKRAYETMHAAWERTDPRMAAALNSMGAAYVGLGEVDKGQALVEEAQALSGKR